MAKTKKVKTLKLTNEEIDELLQIIYDCQSHLQDYDIDAGEYDEETDEGCPYYETYTDCDKWATKLEKLQKSR